MRCYRRAPLCAHPDSVVYFIGTAEGTGPVKIGYTIALARRLSEIERAEGRRMRVLSTFAGGREAERALHLRFAHRRVSGEWFERCKEVLDTAERLRGARANGW